MVKTRWGCVLVQLALVALVVASWQTRMVYRPRLVARYKLATMSINLGRGPESAISTAWQGVATDHAGRLYTGVEHMASVNQFDEVVSTSVLRIDGDTGQTTEVTLAGFSGLDGKVRGSLSASASGERLWIMAGVRRDFGTGSRRDYTGLYCLTSAGQVVQRWDIDLYEGSGRRFGGQVHTYGAVGEDACLVATAMGAVTRYRVGAGAPVQVRAAGGQPSVIDREGGLWTLDGASGEYVDPDGATHAFTLPDETRRLRLRPLAAAGRRLYACGGIDDLPGGRSPWGKVYRISLSGRVECVFDAKTWRPAGAEHIESPDVLTVDDRGNTWFRNGNHAKGGPLEDYFVRADCVPAWRAWFGRSPQ